jgi:adenylate kinase family enzyme
MDLKHFTIQEVREKILQEKPKLILLTGQTCMGKSTFAKSLVSAGYKHIEVDVLIKNEIVKKFNVKNEDEAYHVYKGTAPSKWQNLFESFTKNTIQKELGNSKVIVDAAIADIGVLNRIFSENLSDFFCIYLFPFNREIYFQNIFNRFQKDIKNNTKTFTFWDYVTPEIYDDYLKYGKNSQKIFQVIDRYRDESMALSIERFNIFKKMIPNIILSGH